MCGALGVSRSGYYAWQARQHHPSQGLSVKQWLKPVARAHRASGGVYGSPRIHQTLLQSGYAVSRHTVAKTMKRLNIKGKSAADYPIKRRRDISAFFQKTPCLIENLSTSGINQLWVADLTYIRVSNEWLYLAAVMDAHSRKVIAWDLGKRKDVPFTLSILQRAIARRQPTNGLVFHTDRGAEYAAYAFQEVLDKHGIRPSMNRPGKCTDNAIMESFWHSLKAEMIYGNHYVNRSELREALRQYIDGFYNKTRLHSSLRYTAPMQFEANAA